MTQASRSIVGFAPYNSLSDSSISWLDVSYLLRDAGDQSINHTQGKSNEQSDFDTAKSIFIMDGRNRELDPVVQPPFNPVTNPGFENGTLSGWTQTGAWSIVDQKASLAWPTGSYAPFLQTNPYGFTPPGYQVWRGQYSATHTANAQASLTSSSFVLGAGYYVLSCMAKGYKLAGTAGTVVGLSVSLTGSFTGATLLPMISPLAQYTGQQPMPVQGGGPQQWYFSPPSGSFEWVQLGIYVQITGSTTVTMTGQKGVTGAMSGQIWFEDFKCEGVTVGTTKPTLSSRFQGFALPEKPITWVEEAPDVPSLVEAAGYDGDFEKSSSIAGWSSGNATIGWEGGPGFAPGAYSGNGAMTLTNTSGASQSTLTSPALPASASTTYVAKMRVCPLAAGNRTLTLSVSFYSDVAGTTLISTVTGLAFATVPNQWVLPALGSDLFPSPANTRSARVTLTIAAPGASGEVFRVDRFVFDVAPAGAVFAQQLTHLVDKITPTQPEGSMDVLLKVEASDVFKVLAQSNIVSDAFQQNMLALAPSAYFPLNDPIGSTAVTDLVKGYQGKLKGTYTLGVQGPLVNSPYQATDFGNVTGYVDAIPNAAGNVGTGAFTVCAWVYLGPTPVPAGAGGSIVAIADDPDGRVVLLQVNSSFKAVFYAGSFLTHTQITSAIGLSDGLWHWMVGTRAADGVTMKLYLDGSLAGTGVAGSAYNIVPSDIGIGMNTPPTPQFWGQGAGVGIWTGVELTAAQIAAAYNLARRSWNVAPAGSLIGQILAAIGPGIPFGNGVGAGTLCSPQYLTQNLSDTQALDYVKLIAQSDAGYVYADATGAVSFTSHAILEGGSSTTPVATLGLNVGAGEVPYTHPDGPALEEDVIYNDIRRTRIGGSEQRALDAASAAPSGYWPRRLDETGLLNTTDQDVLNGAQYLKARYAQPHPRISEVTIRAVNGQPPQVWNMAIAQKLGDVVTYNYQPPRGPKTSINARIIKIEKTKRRNVLDVKYMLSSVDGLPFLVLDSATMGALDTGRLGY